MIKSDQNKPADSNINLGTPNLDNTEVAFKSKSNTDLRRAYWLFKMLGSPLVMVGGKYLSVFALRLRMPIKGLIKKTIFKQFCGGETIAECAKTTDTLYEYNIGTILDYSVEGKEDKETFDATCEEILRTVEVAADNPKIPFCVIKVTGICRNDLLEKVSLDKGLTAKEEAEFAELKNRLNRVCKRGAETGTPIFIDAESTWIQQAIDNMTTEMMQLYNQKKAVVYNTLQMYRHDRMAHLREAHKHAQQHGYIYGVKLVRGAYMEIERERAAEMGYPDLIQPDKAATDRDYNAAISFCLDHIDRIAFCAGTHNEESSMFLVEEMTRRNIEKTHPHIYFAQLLGMSDHISFNLSKAGYLVAKYVPYGPVEEVMPYLIRRGEENTSVAGQTGRELTLIQREIKRRKNTRKKD